MELVQLEGVNKERAVPVHIEETTNLSQASLINPQEEDESQSILAPHGLVTVRLNNGKVFLTTKESAEDLRRYKTSQSQQVIQTSRPCLRWRILSQSPHRLPQKSHWMIARVAPS